VAIKPWIKPLTPKINGKNPANNAATVGKSGEQHSNGGIILPKRLPAVEELPLLRFFLNAYTANGRINARSNANKNANNASTGVINCNDTIPTLPPVYVAGSINAYNVKNSTNVRTAKVRYPWSLNTVRPASLR